MTLDTNKQAFLALVRAGLWETDVELLSFGNIDFNVVYRLAEEQSVVGLVAAGLDHVSDVKVPKEDVLAFVGMALQMEQRNTAMNNFIGELIDKMRACGIYTLLVKGQGIAQCYERPLWRSCGDVDFLLSKDNYEKAKNYLLPLSSGNKPDERYSKHLGMSIDLWYVEIHGSLRTGLSERLDKEVDAVQEDVFYGGNVRSWNNDGTKVFLPGVNDDVFFVFTHFVKHFYKEGMNLRQICDWCRLLWTYRTEVNSDVLGKRLRRAGVVSEWNTFAALAVEYLGMPVEAMPQFNIDVKWSKKAEKLLNFIVCCHTRNKVKDSSEIAKIFPSKVLRYFPSIFLNLNGLKIKERLFVDS